MVLVFLFKNGTSDSKALKRDALSELRRTASLHAAILPRPISSRDATAESGFKGPRPMFLSGARPLADLTEAFMRGIKPTVWAQFPQEVPDIIPSLIPPSSGELGRRCQRLFTQ